MKNYLLFFVIFFGFILYPQNKEKANALEKKENGMFLITDQITGKNPVKDYSLSQNYPNPFNPSTKINFSLPEKSVVYIHVYNIIGKEVLPVYKKELEVGFYEYTFDMHKFSSGIYFYKIITSDFVSMKKMMLVK